MTYDFDSSNDSFYLEYTQKTLQETIKKEHYHSAWEFYFYLGDSMTFFIKDTSYNVEKYDLVFVDRHNYHKTRYKNEKKERILVMLRDGFFRLISNKKHIYEYLLKISRFRVLCFDEKTKSIISEKFLRFAQFCEKYPEDSEKIEIFFTEILASIVFYIETNHVKSGTAVKNKNSIIVSQITNFINENFKEKLTLDFLAEKFFVDKYHLCHIFKKETGMTIIDFINQKRIVEAGILLKTTQKSIFDIANSVGFQNQNYFGSMFKKQFGVSPREYRLKR